MPKIGFRHKSAIAYLTDDHVGITVFVIAHKYSTIRSFNKIPYLQDGNLVSFGDWNHVELEVPRFAFQARVQGI